MDQVLEYISRRLKEKELKHEIHTFYSGAVMVDIWKDHLFYVVEIDGKRIGLSLVTEDTGFDIIPDESYQTSEEFTLAFEKILEGV
jgi:hypothetical protein